MPRFDITDTPLPGLRLLYRQPIGDDRGFFERLFCAEDLAGVLGDRRVVQINRTVTSGGGTVRGMHFQHPPHAEAKLVTCLRGEVFDVAVDLRRGSATFLRWHGEILSAENHHSLFIPEGFAHGFQTLRDGCEMLYCHTAPYVPDAEGGVPPLDPRLSIPWPQPVTGLSVRDAGHPPIEEGFPGIDA